MQVNNLYDIKLIRKALELYVSDLKLDKNYIKKLHRASELDNQARLTQQQIEFELNKQTSNGK